MPFLNHVRSILLALRHKYAAGLTIMENSFTKFKSAFEMAVKEKIAANDNMPTKYYDQEITLIK